MEALLTLVTAVRGIQDELSELNNKVDSMVKNITVYNDDETLFLENYWPWKNESQMKKAETDMNEDKTQFNRTVILFELIYTNYYPTFIILFYLLIFFFMEPSPIYNIK